MLDLSEFDTLAEMAFRESVIGLLTRRFLLSKQSDGFLSFISGVSMIGVAMGVMALVVVTSVVNGFEAELTRAITGMNGEVIVYSRGNPVSDPNLLEEKIKKIAPEAQAITRSFVTELMISGPQGVAGAFLEGADFATLGEVTTLPQRLSEGALPTQENEIILGSALAERIGAHVGDDVKLLLPFVGEGFAAGAVSSTPKVIPARVAAIFAMGLYQYDSKYALATLPAIQNALKQPGRVTTFKLKLESSADAEVVSNRLTENFGHPFKAKDWSQLNKNLFYAIRLEKVVISIILAAIIVVAAFNVVSTLMMMIHDKNREIAILKAIGFHKKSAFHLFSRIGVTIGGIGALSGLVLGLGLNVLIEKTRWIHLPADIYYIGFLPVVVRWKEVLLITGLGLLISLLATLYPAIQAANRSPLEGLRYQ